MWLFGGVSETNSPYVFAYSNELWQFKPFSGPIPSNQAVTITSPTSSICEGAAVKFTATPTGGGASPQYQWQLNGANVGTNSPTYSTSSLSNGDIVSCIMQSSVSCTLPATSNSITMVVDPSANAAVSISSTSTSICSGSTATFTAAGTNGGATPGYQWLLNGSNVGTNKPTYSNSTLSNGDVISCIMQSSQACSSPETSNSIVMAVNSNVNASVSITSSSAVICNGTAVTFTATGTNGGATPAYQWLLNGGTVGTNSATYSNPSLANGDVVSCKMTSDVACVNVLTVSSNTLSINVEADVSPAISITASTDNVCAGTPITFTAKPTNGGTTPVYQWQVNGASAGTNSQTYTNAGLANGDLVSCKLISNAACAIPGDVVSNNLPVMIAAAVPTSLSISANTDTICSGINVQFKASPTNEGASPSFQWLLNGQNVGSNAATYSNSTLANGDQVACRMTSNLPCTVPATSANTITMTVTPRPVVNFSKDTTLCNGQSLLLNVSNGNATYLWQNGSTNPLYKIDSAGAYSVKIEENGCDTSGRIVVSYSQKPEISITKDTTLCVGDKLILDASSPNSTYLWQDGSTDAQLVVRTAGLYIVSVSNYCGTKVDSATVVFESCGSCKVYVPLAFSPNHDGKNDLLAPKYQCDLSEYQFKVYGRWGQLLFSSQNTGIGWDGTWRGQPQPPGTYVWELSYRDRLAGNVVYKNGTVVLIR
jgi:gliding motility-associated-like protein